MTVGDGTGWSVRLGYAWSEPPIPGESLIGFVSRNLARHGLDATATCLSPLGIWLRDPGRLAITPHDASALGRLFRADAATLAGMACPPLPGDGNLRADFHGVPMRRTFFSTSRRVSPRSLEVAPYHRAAWHIRPLGFCPESLEPLLENCPDPSCGKALGWSCASQPWECEHCGIDMREHVRSAVECEDLDALTFVSGLLDPNPGSRARSKRMTPTILSDCTPGELFEFAVMLAGVLGFERVNDNKTTWRRLRTNADFERLTPARLASAGRILLAWPDGFHRLADDIRMRADETSDATCGRRRELGVLVPLLYDPLLPQRPKALLKAAIETNMSRAAVILRRRQDRVVEEWITSREVAARFDMHPKAVRRMSRRSDVEVVRADRHSPVLMRASQMEMIAAEHRAALTLTAAASRLGVNTADLRSFAEAGLIKWLAGPAEEIKTTMRRLSGTSITDFTEAMLSRAQVIDAEGPEWIRLSKAITLDRLTPEKVSILVKDTLSGRVASCKASREVHLPLFRQLRIPSAGRGVDGADETGICQPSARPLTVESVARILRTTEVTVSALAAEGWLPATRKSVYRRLMSLADVRAFQDRYMLTGEVARTGGFGCRACKARMAERGVIPAAMIGSPAFPVWDRRQVERALCHAEPTSTASRLLD